MSSKTEAPRHSNNPAAADHRPTWSLGTRLTAWYTCSTCALALCMMAVLYHGLTRSIDDQNDQFLADKLHVVQGLLQRPEASESDLRQEVEEDWATHQLAQVFVRILDDRGRVLSESPTMAQRLPPSTFPPAQDVHPLPASDLLSTGGRAFRGLTGHAVWHLAPDHTCTVQVALDTHSQRHITTLYARWLLLVTAGFVTIAALVGAIVARRGLRPITRIATQIRQTGTTSLHERLPAARLPAEIQSLAQSFNQMLDRLEHAFARLSDFSADIAHELRTPLHTLLSAVDVSLNRPRSADDYRETLGSCAEECTRLSRMIDNLLFLARAEDPRAAVHREQVNVARELDVILEFYGASASETGVLLATDAPPDLTASVDRILFQRAIGNLLVNAIRYTPPGGRVTVAARLNHADLVLEIADTGCGIPEDQLPRVFDRLFRIDRSRSSASGGVGLGLAIVQGIVSLHGGTAQIRSRLTQGTTVLLTFPQHPSQSSPPSPA